MSARHVAARSRRTQPVPQATGAGRPRAAERQGRHARERRPRRRRSPSRGGRIVALGTDAEIKRYIGTGHRGRSTLHGQLVIPGFIEGHGHFTGVGQAQLQLNLMKATSWDEIVAMVADGGEAGEAGAVDLRPRLAPGEVDGAAVAERRRASRRTTSLSRGVAGQPGAADARQRPRQLRQREGDGSCPTSTAPRRTRRAATS